MTIREATEADLSTILSFEQGVVAAEQPYDSALKSEDVHYYDVGALIASDRSMVLVAEDAGRVVGTGHATLKESKKCLSHDQHAYLGLMYVDPQYRGRGIIQRIMDELMEWARTEGITDFYLDVYAENSSAVRAYEKFGFKRNMIEMKLHD